MQLSFLDACALPWGCALRLMFRAIALTLRGGCALRLMFRAIALTLRGGCALRLMFRAIALTLRARLRSASGLHSAPLIAGLLSLGSGLSSRTTRHRRDSWRQ